MISKMVDKVSAMLLLICSHEVWVKVAYDWSTRPCAYACAYVESKLGHKHKHKHKHKKNELVWFFVLMLMSTQFSLASHVLVLMC